MIVEKLIIRKESRFSTPSTVCGQVYTKHVHKLSTRYPQFVDK